jgi:hypothetical protein
MSTVPNSKAPVVCFKCGSSSLRVDPSHGQHHSKLTCNDCGTWRWGKAPWTRERAESFALPWGKHRGKRIGELAQSAEGRDYLRWIAENVHGNVAIAAGIALGLVGPGEAE